MKIIAFYLPQFHTIPENDQWWGVGFTEWTNVKKATSIFSGHRQPRVPLKSNYYDLSNIDVIRWQAQIAREYGVHGFCFYHYWFNGKLLLEKPLELLLSNPDIDINYCISWANENWTNGWVSDENRLLLGHDFDDESDWHIHFQYLLRFFLDHRYMKEDGKPILTIYVPHHIRKIKKMLNLWTGLAQSAGFPGMKYVYQHPNSHFATELDLSLFDYGMEFQPQFDSISSKNAILRAVARQIPRISGWIQKNLGVYVRKSRSFNEVKLIDYDEAWERILQRPPDRSNLIPTAFVDWDNTPRKGARGSVYIGSDPKKFEGYLSRLIQKAKDQYPTDMIFVFAWNEWAEGGYLEPDTVNQFGYLEAIKNNVAQEI